MQYNLPNFSSLYFLISLFPLFLPKLTLPIFYCPTFNQLFTQINISSSNYSILCEIDTSNPYSLFYQNKQYTLPFTSQETQNRISYSKSIFGYLNHDILSISNLNINITKYYFVYYNIHFFDYENKWKLGLGKGSLSFLSQLYSNGYIHHKNYGFVSESNINKTSSHLIIDVDFPKHNAYPSCDMVDFKYENKEMYSCILSSISKRGEDGVIMVNKEVIFDSMKNNIEMPFEYMSEIKKKYFGKSYFNHSCFVFDDFTSSLIYCKTDQINQLQSMIFNFGYTYLEMRAVDLFREFNSLSKMSVMKITFSTFQHNIVFDNLFIQKFSMFFDEDNNKIYFMYNNSLINEMNNICKNKKHLFNMKSGLFIMKILLCVLLSGSVLNIYMSYITIK